MIVLRISRRRNYIVCVQILNVNIHKMYLIDHQRIQGISLNYIVIVQLNSQL
jgi:hypothetical protein